MISDLHFLRPWSVLAIIPFLFVVFFLWRQSPKLHAWDEICDPHLLDHLVQVKKGEKKMYPLGFLFLSALFITIGLAGPTWVKLPVPTYKPINPRVLVLDMSASMNSTDLTPNRLSRAKFKLRDLLSRKDLGQFGLVVFTGEPFILAPLTDDGQTISSLLSALTSDVMPVAGRRLDSALKTASTLIKEAGYSQGQLLVLTADTPSQEDRTVAGELAAQGITSSIMPMRPERDLNPLFQSFAEAGQGMLLPYSPDTSDLDQWLHEASPGQYEQNSEDNIPLWRDEGRWFLIPALFFLLPLFQRGWLQRVAA